MAATTEATLAVTMRETVPVAAMRKMGAAASMREMIVTAKGAPGELVVAAVKGAPGYIATTAVKEARQGR